MGSFFLGWALWQDMTFVLLCAILLVFVVGIVKLWWTNRRIKKYEIIEDERRKRLKEMRHCGIHAVGAVEIPFGARALESGIEVEGIWISRSNTPDGSQVTSDATMLDEAGARRKGKQRARPSTHDGSVSAPAGDGRRSLSRTPAARGTRASTAWSLRDDRDSTELGVLSNDSSPRSHVHAGLFETDRAAGSAIRGSPGHEPTSFSFSSSSTPSRLPIAASSSASSHPASHGTPAWAAPYDAVEAYADQTLRRTSEGFEFIPVAVSASKPELLAYDAEGTMVEAGADGRQHTSEGPDRA
ncbi:hypothetical protein DCS_01134 [Drechmeria coniospora]|uniref:Uncharacterized protein n=1 Tax=Drechmeria coniospora TaxID=98403 RepID=A0A151GSE3_DRECN|nr:hypothetical protein DCS_01134 [Drechmeria coniospora]KYK60000.1 hypothetical protein DCS_01134 [Drechmeria coniospora]ODA78799.1 hypothetical protein RJ55_06183 [Drechmeria coniospora]